MSLTNKEKMLKDTKLLYEAQIRAKYPEKRTDLIEAVFSNTETIYPPAVPGTVQRVRIAGAPTNIKEGARFFLPRENYTGQKYYKIFIDEPENPNLVVEFTPYELVLTESQQPAAITRKLRGAPGNYENGNRYLIPKENLVYPWFKEIKENIETNKTSSND